MSSPFAKHAIEYNDYNLSIIPCGKNKGKIPLVKWQKYQQETADLSVFNAWVEKFPTANIGLITGRLNGLLVVDCDDPKISIEKLQKVYGETPLIVETPRGGKHLYYKYNGESCQIGVSNKMDIRADGGYVIAPYSMNPENGKFYRIIKGSLGDTQNLPASIYTSLSKKCSNFNLNKNSSFDKEGKILEGKRNQHLFKKTKNHAVSVDKHDEILIYAKKYNIDHLLPPLPNLEVLQIVDSVWKYKQENRIWVSGEKHISIADSKFKVLCINPRALALYMLLIKFHQNEREVFLIVHEKVAKIVGCERKTLPKSIDFLIDKKVIERVHIGKGKNDGHRYKFC